MAVFASPPTDSRTVLAVLRTLAIAAAGGAAFALLGVPMAWLTGGMVAVAVAALAGQPVFVPRWLREVGFFVIGAFIGSTLTPETVTGIAVWPLSLVMLCLTLPAITAAGAGVLRWRGGWTRDDSILATMPGALSTAIAIADSIGGDVARIAIVQVLRLAILVLVLPVGAMLAGALPEGAVRVDEAGGADLAALALVCVAGLALAAVFVLVRMPTPGMLGAMVASAALHATGTVETAIPDILLPPCFLLFGAMIGARFAGLTLRAVVACLTDGLLAFLAAFAVSAVAALLVTMMLGLPLGQTVLAFAPGGFEVMAVMAFVMGLDAAYVAIHQVLRFVVLAVSVPIFMRGRPRVPAQRGGAEDVSRSR